MSTCHALFIHMEVLTRVFDVVEEWICPTLMLLFQGSCKRFWTFWC